MSEPIPLSDEERATLVAYLDGELDDEAARQVEARISRDPAVRAEVESMKRTWELLDYLPRAEPSLSFTHRTVSLVTAERRAWRQARRRWRRGLFGVGWAAAVLLAALAGYSGFTRLAPREPTEEQLARDLRVLENQQLYEKVLVGDSARDSLDFLKALDQPDLFGDDNLDTGG
jgi:anti-sigma factor RsiW